MFQDISINPRGAEPVYVRLASAIRERVVSGALLPGQRLPTVREAGRVLGVNANTVQRAYNVLAHEGTLTSRRGAGTSVARRRPLSIDSGRDAHQGTWLSARNQLEGTIRSVQMAGVMAEVVVELPGGQEIVAAITRASAERLGLAAGERAAAIIKSTDVMLARAGGGEHEPTEAAAPPFERASPILEARPHPNPLPEGAGTRR